LILDVAAAVERLERGEVVAYPTETVYGLGADALSSEALARLRALKGRAPERGLSVLIADAPALDRCVSALPEAARRLSRRFWPGPLTLVVPVDDAALGGVATEHGVGFRCSPQPTAAALARAFGRPLVSTSCNATGEQPCGTADEVREAFGAELPIVGGEPSGGRAPSTVVAVDRHGDPKLLREGAVPYTEVLKELTGDE